MASITCRAISAHHHKYRKYRKNHKYRKYHHLYAEGGMDLEGQTNYGSNKLVTFNDIYAIL